MDKAIRDAGLGLNPQMDGQLLRIPLPELNQERRKELSKLAAKYAEAACVAVRNVRRDGMDLLKKLEKDEKIGQDDQHGKGDELQKLTDSHIKDIDRPAPYQGAGNHARSDLARRPHPLLPRHVAIIMDGNGRWARTALLPREAGHSRASKAVRETVQRRGRYRAGEPDLCSPFPRKTGSGPRPEVGALMGLFRALFSQRHG